MGENYEQQMCRIIKKSKVAHVLRREIRVLPEDEVRRQLFDLGLNAHSPPEEVRERLLRYKLLLVEPSSSIPSFRYYDENSVAESAFTHLTCPQFWTIRLRSARSRAARTAEIGNSSSETVEICGTQLRIVDANSNSTIVAYELPRMPEEHTSRLANAGVSFAAGAAPPNIIAATATASTIITTPAATAQMLAGAHTSVSQGTPSPITHKGSAGTVTLNPALDQKTVQLMLNLWRATCESGFANKSQVARASKPTSSQTQVNQSAIGVPNRAEDPIESRMACGGAGLSFSQFNPPLHSKQRSSNPSASTLHAGQSSDESISDSSNSFLEGEQLRSMDERLNERLASRTDYPPIGSHLPRSKRKPREYGQPPYLIQQCGDHPPVHHRERCEPHVQVQPAERYSREGSSSNRSSNCATPEICRSGVLPLIAMERKTPMSFSQR